MKKSVQAKLDEKDIKKLKKKADTTGHSLSSLIRFIVKKYLTKGGRQ